MAKSTATTSVSTETVSAGLGSVGSLFSESWELMKKSWTQQLVFMLIAGVFSFLVFLLSVVLFAVINIPQIPSVIAVIQNGGEGWQALSPTIWKSAVGIGSLMIVLFTVLTTAYAAGMLILVQGIYKGQKLTFMGALRMGFGKVLPMLIVSLLVLFCILGGYGLLIIPGLIIGIFLSYASVEAALYKQSALSAMRKSVQIVSANFWAILGRIILLVLVMDGIAFASSFFGVSLEKYGASGIWSMFNFVLQYALQFFAVSYALVLYNKSRDASMNAKPGSLKLIFVVAIVGWIFAVVIGSAIATAVKTAMPMIQDAIKKEQEKQSADDTRWDGTVYPDSMMNTQDSQGNVFYNYTNEDANTVESTMMPNIYKAASPAPVKY